MELVKCEGCGKDILKEKNKVKYNEKHGYKNYCTRQCKAQSNKTTIVTNCATCGKPIERKKAQFERSKSGNVFCSKSCAITKNNSIYRSGVNSPNYKHGIGNYRAKALKHYGAQCALCNYNIEEVLEVHHKDNNRENNKINNLVVLCPTHHVEVHTGIIKL